MRRDETFDAMISKAFRTEQANGLRRLVWNLVRDDDVVDDVLQDTFVAAVEHPPRDPDRLRAWLATVAKNFVRLSVRSRQRRQRREHRSAQPVAIPSHDSELDSHEIRGLVTDSVDALGEPYRSTLVELFYRDVSAKELARRLDLPESTVRVRKKRALEMLRSNLDQRHPRSRREWIAGAVWWLGSDADAFLTILSRDTAINVAEAVPVISSVATGSLAAAQPTTRTTAVGARWAAVVLGLALIALLFSLPDGPPPSAASAGRSAEIGSGRAPATEGVETAAFGHASHPSMARTTVADVATTIPRTTIVVVDADTGSAIVGARLSCGDGVVPSERRSDGRSATEFLMLPSGSRLLGVSDDHGVITAELHRIRTGSLKVTASGYAERRESARIRFDRDQEPSEYRIALHRAPASTVRVVDVEGTALESVTVTLDGNSGHSVRLETDADGTVTFPWTDRNYVVTVHEDGFVPHRRLARGPLHDVRLATGLSGVGHVRSARGHGISDALVSFRLRGEFAMPVECTTDDQGQFVTPALPATGTVDIEVRHRDHPGYRTRATLPWASDWVADLPDGVWIDGVVDSEAHAVEATTVGIFPSNGSFYARDLPKVRVSSDGRFRVGPVLPGEWSLFVDHPSAANMELPLGTVGAEGNAEVAVVLRDGAAIDGRVVDTEGRPVPGVVIHVGAVFGDSVRGPHAITDEHGAFEVHGLPLDPPRARPVKNDVRWNALGGASDAATGLVLQVCAPHQLVAKEAEKIPHAVLHGSRNTCGVTAGDRGLVLTVRPPLSDRPLALDLQDAEGRPVRTITNLIVTPRTDPERRSLIFAGTSGAPVVDLDSAGWRDALIGVWTRDYAVAFVRPDHDSETTTVVLEPRMRRTVRLEREGEPLVDRDVLVEPIIGGTPTGAAYYVGRTDNDGRLKIDAFASGTYEFRLAGSVGREALASVRPLSTVVSVGKTIPIGSIRWETTDHGERVLHVPSSVGESTTRN